MPREVFGPDFQFMDRDDWLTFDEIERLARMFCNLGVRKVRLTGGEPTLRSGVNDLIKRIRKIPGADDISLTTNGSGLVRLAPRLANAGLERITVSLDTLDPTIFTAYNDTTTPLDEVLAGINAAVSAGIAVRLNCVVKRGVNEGDVIRIVRRYKHSHVIPRFIEYMDVGSTNGWRLADVVPETEILQMIASEFPFERLDPVYPGEVARRYRYLDGEGQFGVVASITQPFCGACSRARLTADGTFYTCLFASTGTPLRELLRHGASDDQLMEAIAGVWRKRTDNYSERRLEMATTSPHVEMHVIGG